MEKTIEIKGVIFEDFVNYKKTSMYIAFPKCDFKCDREYGCSICQNSSLAHYPAQTVNIDRLLENYKFNPITHAFVLAGLEPFDTFDKLLEFVDAARRITEDDIVIYTGFNKEEILDKIKKLAKYPNIIIKFGRFIPNQEPHYDGVLGVKLASDNQYAEKIS